MKVGLLSDEGVVEVEVEIDILILHVKRNQTEGVKIAQVNGEVEAGVAVHEKDR